MDPKAIDGRWHQRAVVVSKRNSFAAQLGAAAPPSLGPVGGHALGWSGASAEVGAAAQLRETLPARRTPAAVLVPVGGNAPGRPLRFVG